MANKIQRTLLGNIDELILLVRGQKVMLDSDLAKMYGVSTMRLNEQFRRNRKRFPEDFAFQLTNQEFTNLKSQIAISSLHGGRRSLPLAFTEHGAIMLASVLNSPIAVDASVRVVRAFVRIREMLSANKELAKKFAELEQRLDGHDEALGNLFEAIRQLLSPQVESKREIGFHIREQLIPYRIKKRI
ncbi:MAG: ORF6N domain-containing protein [Verrucomicrobiota bacterium]|nr:ORF6N domain-containing protein [Verrucomicrobiota bacterium]